MEMQDANRKKTRNSEIVISSESHSPNGQMGPTVDGTENAVPVP